MKMKHIFLKKFCKKKIADFYEKLILMYINCKKKRKQLLKQGMSIIKCTVLLSP